MHLCRAPLDRLAMQQQHFLPLLEPCSYPHLLFPRGSFIDPSPGPQALQSGDVSPMARSPSMNPLTQLVSFTLELMPEPRKQESCRGQTQGDSPKCLQEPKVRPFFFLKGRA